MTSTKIVEINGYDIRVPANAIAHKARNDVAGDYDYIEWRGLEICTQENGAVDDVEQLYVGPFCVSRIGHGEGWACDCWIDVDAKAKEVGAEQDLMKGSVSETAVVTLPEGWKASVSDTIVATPIAREEKP